MSPHSIFERMRADHLEVLAEIAALEKAVIGLEGGGDVETEIDERLRGTVQLLERQFETHMAAEDEVLFPALAHALPESLGRIEPLRAEHAELHSMLASLAGLLDHPRAGERDEQVAVQVHDLVDLLRIHIRKEEAVVFRVAERVLEPRQLQALADRMNSGASEAPDRALRGHPKGNPS